MFDRCYKNIYLLVLAHIPIDFHPILRLVSKRWNRVIKNKFGCLNKLVKYATIELLEFISNQPNITSGFTSLSLLYAGKYDRIDVMEWIKINGSPKYGCSFEIVKILNKFSDRVLTFMIENFFVPNNETCEWLENYGSIQQINLFLDKIIKRRVPKQPYANLCGLAIKSGNMEYVNYFESQGYHPRNPKHLAISSLSIEMIEKYVKREMTLNLWTLAIATNSINLLDYLYNTYSLTTKMDDVLNKIYFQSRTEISETTLKIYFQSRTEISETTLDWVLAHGLKPHASIYYTFYLVQIGNNVLKSCIKLVVIRNTCVCEFSNPNKLFNN